MDKKTEALKLALPVIEDYERRFYGGNNSSAGNAVRSALAEQPAQQEREALLQEIARLHDRIKDLERDVEFLSQPAQPQCRTDGRCQYAIDSGAEGVGHCPKGKCVMPAQPQIYCNHKWKNVSSKRQTAYQCEHCGIYTFEQPAQRKPLTGEFCITDMIDVGHYSLQLIFKSRKHADDFKAAHGIKEQP